MTRRSRLREIVTEQGITVAAVARLSGLSHSLVYAVSKGAIPGPGARERLALALGRAADEVFPIDPPTRAPNV